MGSKVVTIKPDFTHLGSAWDVYARDNKEIQVIFTWNKAKLGNSHTQTVTTCLFRHGLKVFGIGMAIENPLDEPNIEEGLRWAFKRAVTSWIKNLEYHGSIIASPYLKKELDKRLRLALWEATNER